MVKLPAGITISGESGSTLVITRRWLRAKHYVMAAGLGLGLIGLQDIWRASGFSLLFAGWAIVLAWFASQLVPMLVNSTVVSATRQRLEVRHGPLPSLLYKAMAVDADQVEQLYVAPWLRFFEVGAQLRDGTRVALVRPLITREQAAYVEERLEWFLGIVDVPAAASPAPESAGDLADNA